MNKYSLQQNKKRGAALLLFTLLFLFASIILVVGIGRGAYQDIVRYRTLEFGKSSFFGAEAGIEDAITRHRNNKSYSANETFILNGITVSSARSVVTDHFEFDIEANALNAIRKGFLNLGIGNGASFSFGLQSDTGGILMENSSSVLGNIYSNGTVVGTGGGAGNNVFGTVVSAGPAGYVEGIHATGSVFSHDILDSIVDKDVQCDTITDLSQVGGDAYCDNILGGTTVTGSTFPSPPSDQPTTSLPISDNLIESIKADAAAGGVIASTSPECSGGTYTINSDITIGPVKIECNLFVDKNSTDVTLAGQIWVEGNFTTKSGPNFYVDAGLSGKSIPIIVDNEESRSTSSKIVLQNSATFTGSGADSYILLISQNNAEEVGDSDVAINSQQSATGDVLIFSGHGEILIEQSGGYVGVAALLIHLQNSAQIVYELGAINLQFPDGPSAGYVIDEWSEKR